MIRTFVTPTQKNQKIEFDFPEDYLGNEIEIILFKKQEGLVTQEPEMTMADFWNTISDESAKILHQNVTNMRNEWE